MDFRITTGRQIVSAKIQNSRRILQLFGRNREGLNLSEPLGKLQKLRGKVTRQETIASLMGIEGDAAAQYFKCYSTLFLRDLTFSRRTRRPPLDPVNALLSLGYTLITSEATGALAALGLDPYIGFLHEIEYGRPSLALDLIEEFRQPIIDRFILSIANRSIFFPEDFEARTGGGVFLKDAPRKRFFQFYERLMNSPFNYPYDSESQALNFRSLISLQARSLCRCVLTGESYSPFILR